MQATAPWSSLSSLFTSQWCTALVIQVTYEPPAEREKDTKMSVHVETTGSGPKPLIRVIRNSTCQLRLVRVSGGETTGAGTYNWDTEGGCWWKHVFSLLVFCRVQLESPEWTFELVPRAVCEMTAWHSCGDSAANRISAVLRRWTSLF